MRFALDRLEAHGGAAVFGAPIIGAGHSLVHLTDLIKQNKHQPPRDTFREMLGALDMNLHFSKLAGIKLAPKHHQMCHMMHRTRVCGGEYQIRVFRQMEHSLTLNP